jgi:hypothetical protein
MTDEEYSNLWSEAYTAGWCASFKQNHKDAKSRIDQLTAKAMKISDHCRLPGHYWVKDMGKWRIIEWYYSSPSSTYGWLVSGKRLAQDDEFEEIDEVIIVQRESQDDCNCENCGRDPGSNWVASNILDGAANRIKELEEDVEMLKNEKAHIDDEFIDEMERLRTENDRLKVALEAEKGVTKHLSERLTDLQMKYEYKDGSC